MGRIYRGETAVLRHWDDFLHRQYPRTGRVRPEMFTTWTRTLVGLTSTGSRFFQRIVRNFLLFHARDHAVTFIPDRLTFPKPTPPVSPRLVSEGESFVDTSRFQGVCYRAANWTYVGDTTGRTRQNKSPIPQAPPKAVWLYPLRADWQRHLLAP